MASLDLLLTVPRVAEVLVEGNEALLKGEDHQFSEEAVLSVLRKAEFEAVPPVVLDGLWRLLEDCQAAGMASLRELQTRAERVLEFEPFRLSGTIAQGSDTPPRLTLREDGRSGSRMEAADLIDVFSHHWQALTALALDPSDQTMHPEPKFGIAITTASAFLDRLHKETAPGRSRMASACKVIHDRCEVLLAFLQAQDSQARRSRASAVSIDRIAELDPTSVHSLIRDRLSKNGATSGTSTGAVSLSVESRMLEVLARIERIQTGEKIIAMPTAIVEALQKPVPRMRVVLSAHEAA